MSITSRLGPSILGCIWYTMSPSIHQDVERGISQKHVLFSEILSVTSMMRKNSRWATSMLFVGARDTRALGSNLGLRISSPSRSVHLSGRGSREDDLLAGFLELKRAVKDVDGGYKFLGTRDMLLIEL